MNWNYLQPVNIKFGMNTLDELSEVIQEVEGSQGLLVSDSFFIGSGLADEVMDKSKGTLKAVYSDVSPNPRVVEVDACAKLLREGNYDFVVVLGGGSAMDCAKAAACVCTDKESVTAYHGTGKALPKTSLPLIAIPTTAGTGSEVTGVSVLTNETSGLKAPIVGRALYPDFAIVDPMLTVSMPPKVTASAGIDVLSHAIEGYWSKGHQPICDAMAKHAIIHVLLYLERAYNNPNDLEAREKMCEASLIAGLAFGIPKTTSSHACSYPLTNIYGIPHGEACGLTLDYFMRVNGRTEEGRANRLAERIGYKDAEYLAYTIRKLKEKLGLRVDMKDFNLTDAQVDELVQASQHPNLLNNPVEITEDILYDMYQGMR
jgi:alcohol dehydrogenase